MLSRTDTSVDEEVAKSLREEEARTCEVTGWLASETGAMDFGGRSSSQLGIGAPALRKIAGGNRVFFIFVSSGRFLVRRMCRAWDFEAQKVRRNPAPKPNR